MIGAAAGEADVAAFRRGLARGERGWAGLTLPWDADLRALALVDCDLSGAILRGARLEGVALAGARLVQADLRKADLRGASLVRADLRGADLRGADLRNADLTKADLCEADLIAADLRGAMLDGIAVSFGCRAFAGVRLSGDAVRQLYSLILMTRRTIPRSSARSTRCARCSKCRSIRRSRSTPPSSAPRCRVAESALAKLAAFDVALRRRTRMRRPASGSHGTERVEFEPGLGDLLELRYAPSRRFLGREPVHENLLIELAYPLPEAAPATLRPAHVLYRAGSDRITYQASSAVSTFTLVEASPARYVVDAALSLLTPEIDFEHRGPHQLAGQILVVR